MNGSRTNWNASQNICTPVYGDSTASVRMRDGSSQGDRAARSTARRQRRHKCKYCFWLILRQRRSDRTYCQYGVHNYVCVPQRIGWQRRRQTSVSLTAAYAMTSHVEGSVYHSRTNDVYYADRRPVWRHSLTSPTGPKRCPVAARTYAHAGNRQVLHRGRRCLLHRPCRWPTRSAGICDVSRLRR